MRSDKVPGRIVLHNPYRQTVAKYPQISRPGLKFVKDKSAKLKQASETDHRVELSAIKKVADANSFDFRLINTSRYAMRIQDHPKQCFILYITLVLISSTVSCLHKVAPSHKKYIADSYFKKHNSLTDSKFEDYIAQEIAYGSCELEELKVGMKIISLHQKLIGEGSHRHLSLSIRLESLLESKSGSQEFCEAIIIERLPSGVFADSFELQHLVQRGVFTEAGVFGDTNLELPSFRSNRSLIEVHLDIGSKLLSRHKDEVEFKIQLPLHARYQPLGQGFSRVEFRPPNLFMRCSIERKTMEKCLFPLSYRNGESKGDEVVWEIPCGDKEHAGIVSAITFMSAILSALLIILVSIYYSGSNDCPDLKQL
nr:phosphatidylinositol-glycan biosynthesis class X protein [Ipomoea batatas]